MDDEVFTYDGVGNRLTATSGVTWTYNEDDELLDSDSASYEYDDNGNMVKKTVEDDVVNYFYNVEDRLIKAEDGTGTVIAEYYYNPFGRRLWKEVGGMRTYFLYSDEGLVGEYDSSGVELKAYGYKPNTTFTTGPLFMKEEDNYFFYHNDYLGTPQKMTAINGAVVWGAKYTSFGQATIDPSSTINNNLRFPGQYFDQETGLHYNLYRYYDPGIGRFLRTDPLDIAMLIFIRQYYRGAKGDTIGFLGEINLYQYAYGNPVKWIDPSGLWPPWIHDDIIDKAFGDLPPDIRDAIKKGSAYVDNHYPFNAYKHAMRDPFQSAGDAQRAMEEFIWEHMNQYRELKESNELAAYEQLGMALHPVMDLTSPPHRGFQIALNRAFGQYYEMWLVQHFLQELFISDDEMQDTIDKIRSTLCSYGVKWE